MKYWICVTDETNWNVIKTKKIWGVNEWHKNRLFATTKGDKLVFYVKRMKIGGIFEVASDSFEDTTTIFKDKVYPYRIKSEIYPYRVKLNPILVPQKFLEFRPLINKLDFITQKKRKGWGGHLQGKAMRTIPKGDFEFIKEKLKHLCE